MMKHWLIAALVCGFCFVGFSGEADAFGHRRDCCPPPPPVEVVLQVCHPCTGCKHDIAVCVPACCVDAPCVHFEKTLIGCGKTVFDWKCGHRVVVRYTRGGYRVVERG
jgi:hypothetical protein